MRILMNDIAILERAWFRFIGVANQIDRLLLVRLDEAPFDSARKTSSAAPAQTGSFDLVYDLLARHRDGLTQLLVTAIAEIAVDVSGPFCATDIVENQSMFEWMDWLCLDTAGWSMGQNLLGIFRQYVLVQLVIDHANGRST